MAKASSVGDVWLILNKMENEVDREILEVNQEIEYMREKLAPLKIRKIELGELRVLEAQLSKKGLL